MSKVRQLSEELQKIAIKELHEDPKRLEDDLDHIKKWLKKQKHINARTDDQWLISFLRACKFSLERVKQKIDMFYTMKTLSPELFSNRDPLLSEIQSVLDIGIVLPLPKLSDPAAPRILWVKSGGYYDIAKYPTALIMKVATMIQNVMILEDDNLIISGVYVVVDMVNTGLGQIAHVSPSVVKKAMLYFQQGFPLRMKGIYFINTNTIVEIINNIMRPCLSEKLKNRMQIYSNNNFEEIYKYIPKSIFPQEYGGDAGKLSDIAAQWKSKIESYRQFFLDDEQFKSDEKKRPGKPKTTDTVFGLDGSFRQLSID